MIDQDISKKITAINDIFVRKLESLNKELTHSTNYEYTKRRLNAAKQKFIDDMNYAQQQAQNELQKNNILSDLQLVHDLLNDTSNENINACYTRAEERKVSRSFLWSGLGAAFLLATVGVIIFAGFVATPASLLISSLIIAAAAPVAVFLLLMGVVIIDIPFQKGIQSEALKVFTDVVKNAHITQTHQHSIFKPANNTKRDEDCHVTPDVA